MKNLIYVPLIALSLGLLPNCASNVYTAKFVDREKLSEGRYRITTSCPAETLFVEGLPREVSRRLSPLESGDKVKIKKHKRSTIPITDIEKVY